MNKTLSIIITGLFVCNTYAKHRITIPTRTSEYTPTTLPSKTKGVSTRSFDFDTTKIHTAIITNESGQTAVCDVAFRATVLYQGSYRKTDVRTKQLTFAPGQRYTVLLGNPKKEGFMPYLSDLIDHSSPAITTQITRDPYDPSRVIITLNRAAI